LSPCVSEKSVTESAWMILHCDLRGTASSVRELFSRVRRTDRDQVEDSEDDVGKACGAESAKLHGFGYVSEDKKDQKKQRSEDAEAEGETLDARQQEAEGKIIWREFIYHAKSNEQASGRCAGHPNALVQKRARALI
jgi:hypothetical protein